jgi:hypothetical protein
MTITDILRLLNENKELLGVVLTAVAGLLWGKKKVDQARASYADLRAKAFEIADGLVAQLVRADAVTADTVDKLAGEWRTAFEMVARALHLDVTPEQLGKLAGEVRGRVATAIAAYGRLRLPDRKAEADLFKKWDHLINDVAPKHHAKLKAAAEATKRRQAEREAKALRAANKAAARRLDG